MRGFLLMAMFVASLFGAASGTTGTTSEMATTVDDVTVTAIDAGAHGRESREPLGSEGLRSGASFRVAGGGVDEEREVEPRSTL